MGWSISLPLRKCMHNKLGYSDLQLFVIVWRDVYELSSDRLPLSAVNVTLMIHIQFLSSHQSLEIGTLVFIFTRKMAWKNGKKEEFDGGAQEAAYPILHRTTMHNGSIGAQKWAKTTKPHIRIPFLVLFTYIEKATGGSSQWFGGGGHLVGPRQP